MEEKKDTHGYSAPEGIVKEIQTKVAGEDFTYAVTADWTVLRKKEKPAAEIFSVSYQQKGPAVEDRPITFVFNGGPGAASAYLHLGALGPRRVVFESDGNAPKPPVVLGDNEETWLEFTDLVFVDPVGTGFSRSIEEKDNDGKEKENTEYYGLKRDLESLGEFMRVFLSDSGRWESPVYIAGESYGGYRAARLSRILQEGYGIGLNGSILISPALEFNLLDPNDYDVLSWLDLFPSMAGAATVHGKSRKFDSSSPISEVLRDAEAFSVNELSKALTQGELLEKSASAEIFGAAADYLGLPLDIVASAKGRVSNRVFARTLLRDERKVCGMYDATITAIDPFPDRQVYEGPDPTLFGIERVFASGINAYLRTHLGVKTDRDYHLLSLDVNRKWKNDVESHAFQSPEGATDDLRYGMAVNPHMRVYVCHGFFDLVTPYFSSTRISNLMKLDDASTSRLTVKHYYGGHMFYAHDDSRKVFVEDIKNFYNKT